ncbi:MAG TPA: 6-phosphogluconolactonase [Chitinophagaceae bacterium]|nr:6-phosphogluconolactonase [Chitinophagaceae bacterium]
MKIIPFESFKELEQKLANEIAQKLIHDIELVGKASLLVSGGTTPIGMFHLLSLKQLNWSKVTIGLVDERFVPSTHEASNEKLVRDNLLKNEAAFANFIPMVYNTNNEEENLVETNIAYFIFKKQVSVSVLGMGEDGHTASLFPGDKNSENDLKSSTPCIISTKSPTEPSHRITCSKSLLLQSKSIYLMIQGASKKQVLNAAIVQDLPISHFLSPLHEPLKIFYADKK